MAALGHLAVLFGLISFSLAHNPCPPDQIDSVCKCSHKQSEFTGTVVACRNIQNTATLLKEIQFYRGYKIDALLLELLELPFLPAGLFLGTSFREIIIKDSILDNLYSTTDYTPSPFAGLEDSLEEFSVYSTKNPSKWYFPDMKGFKQLKQIRIIGSPINFISHFFAEIGEGSLESITVAYSDVYRIHPQAFPEITNLKEVTFRGNYIPYMVRTMFPAPARQLKRIDLSDNKLFTLPENMFDNMPVLKFLDLSQNEFKIFQNMPAYSSLEYFQISFNPFECGCHLLPLKQLITSHINNSDAELVECLPQGGDKKISLTDFSFDSFKCY